MFTDIGVSEVTYLGTMVAGYGIELDAIKSISDEAVEEGEHAAFYAVETALYELILIKFFIRLNEGKPADRVTVRGGRGLRALFKSPAEYRGGKWRYYVSQNLNHDHTLSPFSSCPCSPVLHDREQGWKDFTSGQGCDCCENREQRVFSV